MHFKKMFWNGLIMLCLSTVTICCNNKNDGAKNYDRSYEIVPNEKDTVSNNLTGYDKYQTFDEFTLSGLGKVVEKPYVFVKKSDDTITVRRSDNIDNCIIYKKENGVWSNELYLEMNKQYKQIAKDGELPARYYYRFFANDSIFEYKESFYGENIIKNIFIKTRQKCTSILLINSIDIVKTSSIANDVRKLVDDYKKDSSLFVSPVKIVKMPNFRSVRVFNIIETQEDYLFKLIGGQGMSYVFTKSPLGFWGIQPGFDKIDKDKTWDYQIRKK